MNTASVFSKAAESDDFIVRESCCPSAESYGPCAVDRRRRLGTIRKRFWTKQHSIRAIAAESWTRNWSDEGYRDRTMAKRPSGSNARARNRDPMPPLVVKFERRDASLPPSLAWRRLWDRLLSTDKKDRDESTGEPDRT